MAGSTWGLAPNIIVVLDPITSPARSILARSTATAEASSSAAASFLPSALMRSPSDAACASIRTASASDCAAISRALALPRAATSACAADADATAPWLKACASFSSLGNADTTLIFTTRTPYWLQILLAFFAHAAIWRTLNIWASPGQLEVVSSLLASAVSSESVNLLSAETCLSPEYMIEPIVAERDPNACFSTSRLSTARESVVPVVDLPADPVELDTPGMVSVAIKAARAGSSMRQFTMAVVSRTTLSAVVELKGPKSSVWIFSEMKLSNFQLRCVSM
mmetsp:Transcript_123950/g.246774  ORF Transcript_123950/g.246774 Transcript_123950/m.246774 type:complete len:281 (-) Transcript_123950:669-1511(-)